MTKRSFNLKAKAMAEDFLSGMAEPAPKRKYRNTPTVLDGIRFDSKGEAQRWAFLKTLERAGQIARLARQVEYVLNAPTLDGGWTEPIIGKYVADFEYWVLKTATTVTEDFKGVSTPLFKWKRKHWEAQYGRKLHVVNKFNADIAR